MKKGFKVLLIIAVCLIIAGTVAAIASFFMGGLDFDGYGEAVTENVGKVLRRFGANDKFDASVDPKRIFGGGEDQALASESDNAKIPAADVRDIEINWVSGDIEIIAQGDGDYITVSESYHGFTDSLRYSLTGRKLRIDFSKNEFLNFSFSGSKDLTVIVPQSYAGSLDEISVECVSADCTITGLASGELDFSSVSGALDALGSFDTVDVDTVSGFVNILAETCPRELSVDTTSGDVFIEVPENSSFKLDFDSVSGKFTTGLTLWTKGDSYTVGSGEADFDVSTVSGDLSIESK